MFRKFFNKGGSSDNRSEPDDQYGIDRDCNYCPTCGEAYRAEIETCAECGIQLIPGTERLDELQQREAELRSLSMDISAGDELVTIQAGKVRYLKEQQQLLKKAHVPSVLAGDNPSKGWGGPNLQLKVKAEDARRAAAVIKQDFIETTGLDSDDFTEAGVLFAPEAETVICPACSTRFKPTERTCPECGLEFGGY